jgi:hypothetical protein
MGMPIFGDGRIINQPTKDLYLGSDTEFVHIFDLQAPASKNRMFIGIHVFNPSSTARIEIVGGAADEVGPPHDIVIPPLTFLTFDLMTFGIGARDLSKGIRIDYIRAKLNLAAGVLGSATIDYSGSGQPSDGELVNVNGKVYEFSDDQSKVPANDFRVDIGASADITWTALDVTIDTGLDIVTLTSNYGGVLGNDIPISDGATPTGAVFSGNTAGGSGGVQPTIHIW